jgi:hypothetical protein
MIHHFIVPGIGVQLSSKVLLSGPNVVFLDRPACEAYTGTKPQESQVCILHDISGPFSSFRIVHNFCLIWIWVLARFLFFSRHMGFQFQIGDTAHNGSDTTAYGLAKPDDYCFYSCFLRRWPAALHHVIPDLGFWARENGPFACYDSEDYLLPSCCPDPAKTWVVTCLFPVLSFGFRYRWRQWIMVRFQAWLVC